MDEITLNAIVKNSGGFASEQDVAGLLNKINFLKITKRYDGLIKRIVPAKNAGDFLGSVFEINLAFQFESNQLQLEYGAKQNKEHGSDIDLLLRLSSGQLIYLEAKLLQQDAATNKMIEDQINESSSYYMRMDGGDINNTIERLQNTIISKLLNKNGAPIKFFSRDNNVVNIVAINVSELIVGCIDKFDCAIATHGSDYVKKVYGDQFANLEQGKEVVGLFQTIHAKHFSDERFIAAYSHVKEMLHGVLFLFKAGKSGLLSYELEHTMMWNPSLIDQDRAKIVSIEIAKAIPIKSP